MNFLKNYEYQLSYVYRLSNHTFPFLLFICLCPASETNGDKHGFTLVEISSCLNWSFCANVPKTISHEGILAKENQDLLWSVFSILPSPPHSHHLPTLAIPFQISVTAPRIECPQLCAGIFVRQSGAVFVCDVIFVFVSTALWCSEMEEEGIV